MVDSKNKDFYCVMWLPNTTDIIWEMKNKTQMSSNFYLYNALNQYIDLKAWIQKYSELYKEWLEDDKPAIYDLQNQCIAEMLKAIQKLNKDLPNYVKLFYWFDIDRTENEDFIWEISPINHSLLLNLGEEFCYLNRLVDVKNYLVFPAQEEVVANV